MAELLLYGGPVVQGILCCESVGAPSAVVTSDLFGPIPGNREQAKKMHAAFELSEFRPVINKVFEFHQLKEAYDYSVSGDHFGKIVIKVA